MTDENTNPADTGGEPAGAGDGGADGGTPPEGPDAFEFNVPDLGDLELPEGFDKENFKLELADDDPRIPALKQIAHQHGMPQEALNDLAKLWAQHELTEMHSAGQAAQAELQKLGENAQSRLDSLERALRGRFPKAQAEALLNDVTSAGAVQALESLLGSGRQASGAQPGGRPNLADMTIDERLALASQQRQEKRAGLRRR